MKHTTASTISTGSWSTAGYTLVFSGTITVGSTNGWKTFDLSTPFNYNNVDNLQILVVNNSGSCVGTSGAAPSWRFTSFTGTDVRARYAPGNTALPTFISATGNRANFRMVYTTSAAAPTGASASPAAICNGSSSTVSVTGGSVSSTWYTGSCGGTSIGTGTSRSVSPTVTTTYFVANPACGGITSCQSVTVTVNPSPGQPPAPSISTNTCGNKTVTFGTPPAGQTYFYQGTTSDGTATTSNVSGGSINITASGTYYYRARDASGCWSPQRSFAVTFNPIPVAPTVSGTSFCTESAHTITPSAGGATYNFYAASSGGGPIAGGSSVTSYSATFATTTTLYVASLSAAGCESTTRTPVTITIHPETERPPVIGVVNDCGSSTLTFANPTQANTIFYYQGTGGPSSTLTTTPVNASTSINVSVSGTYRVRGFNTLTGCWGQARGTTISILEVPTAPAVAGATHCGATSVTLNPTGGSGTYSFYPTAAAATPIAGGANVASYTATFGSTTTLHVASVTAAGCESTTRTAVTVTIGDPSGALTWTGLGSTAANSWFDAANWNTGCLPSCATDVTIPTVGSANYPRIQSAAATRNIDLQAGSSLSFDAAEAKLTICGNFTHAGSLPAITDAGTGIVEFTGTVTQTCHRAGGTGGFPNLIVNNPAGLNFTNASPGQNLVVSDGGTLSLVAGIITLPMDGSTVLNVRNRAPEAITGYAVSNYVQGALRRALQSTGGDYAFPVGSAAKGYQLIRYHFNTGSTDVDRLTVHFNDGPGGSTAPTGTTGCASTSVFTEFLDNGWWSAVPTNAGYTDAVYDVTLYNRNYTNAGVVHTVVKRPAAGAWDYRGNCSGTSAGATSRSGVTGFSDFATLSGDEILPAEALRLQGLATTAGNDLRWSVAAEVGVAQYQLMRRDVEGAAAWQLLAQLNVGSVYRYQDAEVSPGSHHQYRVVAVDHDGKRSFSNIVELARPGTSAPNARFGIYPQPAAEAVNLRYELVTLEPFEIALYDAKGARVLHQTHQPSSLHAELPIRLADLSDGIYSLVITSPNATQSLKLLKTRN